MRAAIGWHSLHFWSWDGPVGRPGGPTRIGFLRRPFDPSTQRPCTAAVGSQFAAVDDEARSGDPLRPVGGEIGDGFGDAAQDPRGDRGGCPPSCRRARRSTRGRLGHLAVKMASALGAHVVAYTTSAAKADEALTLGAHEVVLSRDAEQMAAQHNRLDFVLDTVPITHRLTPYVHALVPEGALCSVGVPDAFDVAPAALVLRRKTLAGAGRASRRDRTLRALDAKFSSSQRASAESSGRSHISMRHDRPFPSGTHDRRAVVAHSMSDVPVGVFVPRGRNIVRELDTIGPLPRRRAG